MARKVKPIPDGCEGVTPYLCVNGASAAIEFYKKPSERRKFTG